MAQRGRPMRDRQRSRESSRPDAMASRESEANRRINRPAVSTAARSNDDGLWARCSSMRFAIARGPTTRRRRGPFVRANRIRRRIGMHAHRCSPPFAAVSSDISVGNLTTSLPSLTSTHHPARQSLHRDGEIPHARARARAGNGVTSFRLLVCALYGFVIGCARRETSENMEI